MNQAWARWVLVVCNAFGALASVVLTLLTWSFGSDHHVGGVSFLLTLLFAFGCSAVLGRLAYRQTQRQGRVMQTVFALLALALALATWSWIPALYGSFALVTVWWLGDFLKTDEPTPLAGTPDAIARVMWRRGDNDAAIRSALAARNAPADEIEKLMYELALDEETRQRMSPGR